MHWLGGVAMLVGAGLGHAQPLINEILINPPGTDTPNEYIELRGPPNFVFPAGSYLVVLEGDTNSNPGAIDDVFELSGKAIGGNGFLVFLQKGHPYTPHPNASVYVNTGAGDGWGDGHSSSLGHRGNLELENGSQTFFLIQTTNPPVVHTDLDPNNNGVPDHPDFNSWLVWDAIGVMDADADITYGTLNFRIHPAGIAWGLVVAVTFEQKYIGRNGNSVGSAPSAWIAGGDVDGTVPAWILNAPATYLPPAPSLNHLGAPNFGAAAFPGVVARQSGGSTRVGEGSGSDSYELFLNTPPSGSLTLELRSVDPVQLSLDGGATYGDQRTLTLADTTPRTVLVRALDDNVVDTSPNLRPITHVLLNTGDPAHYPLTSLMPVVNAQVVENDWLRLNELKVNPPGTNDAPFEFIELRGPPNALLKNVYVLALDGDAGGNPGRADVVVALDQARVGGSGLLVIVPPGHPYLIPDGTTVFLAAQLAQPGGGLDNGTISFLLVSSPTPLEEGTDLDAGDNGTLEGLPASATILDAVGWNDGNTNDVVYGGVSLQQTSGTPDAATRFSYDLTPNSAAAWFNGNLAGTSAASLIYDSSSVSANFPFGAILTPGIFANSPPSISPLVPFSNVIADPTSPAVTFQVGDAETAPAALTVTARSSNPGVVPDHRLTITANGGGQRTLRLDPVGVGYATIILTVDDGDEIAQTTMDYAASAMDRAGGRFHTGMSDASSAMPLDATYMLVADDENQTLRIFDRTRSGGPLRGYEMNPFLDLLDYYADGTPREVDIEGSTRVGDRIYWMGGHSHARNAESRTNRGRLFATDLAGTGTNVSLTFVGHYDFLKLDIMNWDQNNLHGKGANYYGLVASGQDGVDPKEPDGSGFNLEGLCMAPGSSTTAYLAFRAPLAPPTNRHKALILVVTNFASLAVSYGGSGSARFGPPIELDLNGHAIRSLEGNSHGYVIVAGPPDIATEVHPKNFELYTWSGQPQDPPQLRAADMSGIIPEGIVETPPGPWTEDTQVQLISDNGITVYYADDLQAKQLKVRNFKKFRSDWVRMGPVTAPPPVIRSLSATGTHLWLSWKAVAGHTYRVQQKADMAGANWVDLPGEVIAADSIAGRSLPIDLAGQRFYRVVCLP